DPPALFATDLARLCSATAHFGMRQVRCILGCAKDHSGHGEVEQAHAIERQDGNAKHGHRRSVLEKAGLKISMTAIQVKPRSQAVSPTGASPTCGSCTDRGSQRMAQTVR